MGNANAPTIATAPMTDAFTLTITQSPFEERRYVYHVSITPPKLAPRPTVSSPG